MSDLDIWIKENLGRSIQDLKGYMEGKKIVEKADLDRMFSDLEHHMGEYLFNKHYKELKEKHSHG